ncbi:Orotate phosphoribosyltransferase [Chitinispirillum alkaliphilum]|nr:Orotate phosphoribosyltransferase [Chitinispirillum alkaliphilum]
MEQYKKEFIEFMIESKVLKFGDFVTKSGRKTPFFINTGNYSTGEQLLKLGQFYAAALNEHMDRDFDVLFGPAYKGIPLGVTASTALFSSYSHNVSFCFNRKEIKDHGEGGSIVGHPPQASDRVVIIEDVTTAGTSVRESIPLLKACADLKVVGLVVSVDRMERGSTEKSALSELQDEFGLKTFAIVTLDEIVSYLHNREINGEVILDDSMLKRIEEYRKQYGATG